MATTKFQSGGAFQPGEPVNLTGDASNFINPPTIGGTATVAGTSVTVGTTDTQTLTNKTLTSPTITGATLSSTGATLTAPVISGAATLASGAVITTPTILMTAQAATATGVTGTDSTALSAIVPALVSVTGASGAGIGIPTGAAVAGATYDIRNINVTGVQNVYAVGGTINGTTGTTAFGLSPTGTKAARLVCVTAGAWLVTAISTT